MYYLNITGQVANNLFMLLWLDVIGCNKANYQNTTLPLIYLSSGCFLENMCSGLSEKKTDLLIQTQITTKNQKNYKKIPFSINLWSF